MNNLKLKQAQVWTAPWVTDQLIDLLGEDALSSPETYFFEPCAGDGSMLVVILERIFQALLKIGKDKEQALVDTLHKFYAIELDEQLVPIARKKIFEWARKKIERELSAFESYLIAQLLSSSIACADFFEVMGTKKKLERKYEV